MVATTYMNSPIGVLELKGSEEGLQEIVYKNVLPQNLETEDIPSFFMEAIQQLTEYFSHQREVFDLELAPKGTPFQQLVWKGLQEIPYGKTISYKDQAIKMKKLKAIRAIASANGKNPLPIIIPCHRVIGSNGKLTGYAGGLGRKKWLLDHEKALTQGVRELSLF